MTLFRRTPGFPRGVARLAGLGVAMAALGLLSGACAAASAAGPDGHNPASGPLTTPVAQPAQNDLCLACHGKPGITMTLDHAQVALDPIAGPAFTSSAHGTLTCSKCHPVQATVPHAPPPATGGARGPIDAEQLCSSCHKGAAEGYEHTAHGTVSNFGDRRAPGCTDCHSAHAVKAVAQWTSADRAQACARCHAGANAQFAQASTGHKEASMTWFAPTYFAGRFLVVLLACTLAFGTLHVELDLLRWGASRLRRRNRNHSEKSE